MQTFFRKSASESKNNITKIQELICIFFLLIEERKYM